jgi:hypothetical protein
VDESDSAAGQVLLLGGGDDNRFVSTVHLVDLATGACAQQPDLLRSRLHPAAGRLPDGRIVCAGGLGPWSTLSSAEVWGPPAQGPLDAAWSWKELPAMIAGRFGCCGCVMSDGRFAVLGGMTANGVTTSSCEVLVVDGDEHWEPLPPMHEPRAHFACAAVAGCIIVAGGSGVLAVGGPSERGPYITSAEVYDEVRGRWLRLPCNLPHLPHGLRCMGSALL